MKTYTKAELLKAIGMAAQDPPERIYGWMQSQLSIARFYGGITYQGHSYKINAVEPGCPLVRSDVLKKESKSKSAKDKAAKRLAKEAQKGLL